MGDDKIQNIGVKKKKLDEANRIPYECRPNDWQMFDLLVSFCKDCPDAFNDWKKIKLEEKKKEWEKKKLKK